MPVAPTRYNFRVRVLMAGLCLGLLYGVLIARAVDLMVIQGPKLREMAQRQHQRIERLAPKRGPILDFNGAVLAESVPVDSVYAHPNLILDPEAAAEALAAILGEKKDKLLDEFTSDSRFVWIKRVITPQQAKAVRRENIPGVVVVGEYARYYPQGSLGAHIIGFVGADGEGLEGLEKKFDRFLAGSEEKVVVQRDARGKPLYPDPKSLPEPRGGSRLVLTIDTRIQAILEEALDKALASSSAENAMAAVMESQTGRILAMAVRPTYNPNRFRDYPQQNYRNRFISDVFEPGSTFKTYTLSALIDSKKGSLLDEVFCEEGAFELDGHIINDTHSYGWFTVEEVIVHSSNIGAAKLGLKLGRDILGRYVSNFGFGSATGIDLPGESRGLVRPFKQISRTGVANMAFGQGIGVTGLQLLTSLNAIASGGKLIVPHVVDRIEDENGNVVQSFGPQVVREVLNPASVQTINKVLINVIHGGGTGKRAAPAGYIVAGKTGTAQKVNLETGGYYDDKYIASFMGYAPADKPRISVIVVVNDPKGEPWGGSVAGPAFKEIVERTLPLLGVLPDRNLQGYTDPTLVASADPTIMPAIVTANVPATREAIICAECVPDLTGLALREVLLEANRMGASVEAFGSGRVVSQKPAAGTMLEKGKKWRVELAIDPSW